MSLLDFVSHIFQLFFFYTFQVKYSLQYSSDTNQCSPRSWKLQGANSSVENVTSVDNLEWVDLSVHENDTSMTDSFVTKSWEITPRPARAYRFFRILQTGKNNFAIKNRRSDLWSNCLVVHGFELFGDLLSSTPIVVKEKKVIPPIFNKNGEMVFSYGFDGDKNGVINYLKNSKSTVSVLASSIGRGQGKYFIDTGEVACWTHNKPNSWFAVKYISHLENGDDTDKCQNCLNFILLSKKYFYIFRKY